MIALKVVLLILVVAAAAESTNVVVIVYLRNKETHQTKNIIFACLNDGLVKSLLKISY